MVFLCTDRFLAWAVLISISQILACSFSLPLFLRYSLPLALACTHINKCMNTFCLHYFRLNTCRVGLSGLFYIFGINMNIRGLKRDYPGGGENTRFGQRYEVFSSYFVVILSLLRVLSRYTTYAYRWRKKLSSFAIYIFFVHSSTCYSLRHVSRRTLSSLVLYTDFRWQLVNDLVSDQC